MSSITLSEHFSFDEFVKESNPKLTSIQWYMLQNLCQNILEPLRAFAGQVSRIKNCFTITSGMRFPSDRERLIKQGYHPSETTDHDYGQAVKLTREKNIAKYGEYYFYSMGAADIVPACGALFLFEKCKQYFKHGEHAIDLPTGKIFINQFILEKGKDYWLHISNPVSLLYKEPMIKFLDKDCFLQSLDNGSSYQRV